MTSGRRPCQHCQRNSPQGAHATCAVLATLRDAANHTNTAGLVDVGRLHAATCGAPCLPSDCQRISRAIVRLRAQGHRIAYFSNGTLGGGWYRLNGEAT